MKIKCHGTDRFEVNERSWTNWWLLEPSDATDSEIIDAVGAESFYTGPGQMYGWETKVRRTKTRILLTQMCGYDI